jgi:hypothetical protein
MLRAGIGESTRLTGCLLSDFSQEMATLNMDLPVCEKRERFVQNVLDNGWGKEYNLYLILTA